MILYKIREDFYYTYRARYDLTAPEGLLLLVPLLVSLVATISVNDKTYIEYKKEWGVGVVEIQKKFRKRVQQKSQKNQMNEEDKYSYLYNR